MAIWLKEKHVCPGDNLTDRYNLLPLVSKAFVSD